MLSRSMIRSCSLWVGFLIVAQANAATVWLNLVRDPAVPGCSDCTLSGPGTWNLVALAGQYDNAGISHYNIPLLNTQTVNHASPSTLFAQDGSLVGGTAGFTLFRTGDNVPTVFGAQDVISPTPHLLYGLGQVAGSFAGLGLNPLSPAEQASWNAPLLLAEGTYESGHPPEINDAGIELAIGVFTEASPSTETESATILLERFKLNQLLDTEITIQAGEIATYEFTAPDEVLEAMDPTTTWDVWGFDGPNGAMLPEFDPENNTPTSTFQWDSTGVPRGTYFAEISVGNYFSLGPYHLGTVTIHVVPEPASAVLLGLGAIWFAGAFRRCRRAGMIRQSR